MPTKDYNPINEIVSTIINTHELGFGILGPSDASSLGEKIYTNLSRAVSVSVDPRSITIEKSVEQFPKIRSILANKEKGAFTVAWDDRTSTVIHLQDGDEWDDEKALAMCFVKKLFGNKGSFNNIFTEELPKKLKTIPKKEPKNIELYPGALHTGTLCAGESMVKETTSDKTDSLQSKVTELLGESKKTEKTEMFYSVYIYNTYTKRRELLDGANPMTLLDARKRVNMLQTVSGYPHVSRVWETDGELYIDYGSYVNYIVIPGLTPEEYLG